MSHPVFPRYPQSPQGMPAADPGPIPLRPLRAGELLAAGFGVVRRHLALLAPLAVLVSVLSSAANLGILSATGTLNEYADGTWYADLLAGRRTSLPASMYLAAGASAVIAVVGTLAISGLAAACAGVDAMGRHTVRGALAERLSGRVGALIATAAVAGVAVTIGLALVVVPGVVIYLAWAAAVPAVAMERTGVGDSLARSARMTRGHRGRILGVTVLVLVLAFVIDMLVAAIVARATGSLTPVASLVVSDAVGAVVAAVTTSWVGSVIALCYIDIRVRVENLGPALRAFAAADRRADGHGAGGPVMGRA